MYLLYTYSNVNQNHRKLMINCFLSFAEITFQENKSIIIERIISIQLLTCIQHPTFIYVILHTPRRSMRECLMYFDNVQKCSHLQNFCNFSVVMLKFRQKNILTDITMCLLQFIFILRLHVMHDFNKSIIYLITKSEGGK